MKVDRKETMKRLLKLLANYKILLVLIFTLSIVQVSLTVYLPLLIGRTVDAMLGANQVNFEILWTILMQMIVVVIINTVIQWVLPLIYQKIAYELTRDLRQAALDKLHTMPLSFIDRQGTGDLISRLTTDSEQLNDGLLLIFQQFLIGVLIILFTLVMMFQINPVMMAVVAILTPISLVVSQVIARRSYDEFSTSVRLRGELSEVVEESVTQHEIITLFNIHQDKQNQFDALNEFYSQHSQNATFISSTVNPVTRFINALIYAGVTFMGAVLIINGGLTVGGLTVFLNYAREYTKPFNDISNVLAELQSALASADRLFEILDQPSEMETGTKTHMSQSVEGEIAFENLDFSYTEDTQLIQDFNVEVNQGMKVAIVGPTGAGKSTMINLLMRFYEPDEGQIILDGEPITDYTRASLREQLGMVLQDVWLKSGTVHENIAYGFPNASREQVVEAAKSAHAHKFIEALPNGYDTVLTDGGLTLSKGEQQLLSIARIFVSIPNILILDEATSSIDTRTEMVIQDAFHTLMEGRTSFIIAHRLSTIQDSDLILVMQDGQVVEQGNHQELMKNHGLYHQMQSSRTAEII